MPRRCLTVRESSQHATFWQVAVILIGVHFALGLLFLLARVFLFESDGRALPLDGLGIIDQVLVVAVFRSWIVQICLLAMDLAAFWIMYSRLDAVTRRRTSDAYLTVVLVVCLGHSALVIAALWVSVFRAIATTYVVEAWYQIQPLLIINAVLTIPAVVVWIGTRFRLRDGHCARCGYEIEGITGRCPECGEST